MPGGRKSAGQDRRSGKAPTDCCVVSQGCHNTFILPSEGNNSKAGTVAVIEQAFLPFLIAMVLPYVLIGGLLAFLGWREAE